MKNTQLFLLALTCLQSAPVMAENYAAPGEYVVTVSREEDDWYEVFGEDLYIKTSSCLSPALSEEAYLTVDSFGSGSLRFEDGEDCMVEGIYTKPR